MAFLLMIKQRIYLIFLCYLCVSQVDAKGLKPIQKIKNTSNQMTDVYLAQFGSVNIYITQRPFLVSSIANVNILGNKPSSERLLKVYQQKLNVLILTVDAAQYRLYVIDQYGRLIQNLPFRMEEDGGAVSFAETVNGLTVQNTSKMVEYKNSKLTVRILSSNFNTQNATIDPSQGANALQLKSQCQTFYSVYQSFKTEPKAKFQDSNHQDPQTTMSQNVAVQYSWLPSKVLNSAHLMDRLNQELTELSQAARTQVSYADFSAVYCDL